MKVIPPIHVEIKGGSTAVSDGWRMFDPPAGTEWVVVDDVSAESDVTIKGIITNDAMIAAGAEELQRYIGDHPEAARITDAVYCAMRKATGEGIALRRVGPKAQG